MTEEELELFIERKGLISKNDLIANLVLTVSKAAEGICLVAIYYEGVEIDRILIDLQPDIYNVAGRMAKAEIGKYVDPL